MSSAHYAPEATVDLAAFTYQSRSPLTRGYPTASFSEISGNVLSPPAAQREYRVKPSRSAIASPVHGPKLLTYSTAAWKGRGHAPPYSSPIRICTKNVGDGRHAAPASNRDSAWQKSPHIVSESARDTSPQPRTPPKHGGHNSGTAVVAGSGGSRHGVGYADLRHLSVVGFTPPSTSHVAFSVPSSAAMCWVCEVCCRDGPGSTWPEAPALFFARAADKLPVSLLTLCHTCAIAVGADMRATTQQVLQRCHHTPVLRYRTAAYLNAIREYKLLLELMARKVVRSCERMKSIQSSLAHEKTQQRRLHTYGAAEQQQRYLNPSMDAARMPLTFLSPSLQGKVLSQLLEALEDLLQRDGRAVRLAATRTSLSQEKSPLPLCEVMAPRERHMLLEELAHVERQLVSVKSSATSAITVPVTPGASSLSQQGRHLYDVPPEKSANTRGKAHTSDTGLAYSPRSLVELHRSPQSNRVVEEAAHHLAAVADPHGYFEHHHDRMPGRSQAAPIKGHRDMFSQVPRQSRNREFSPPELTPPQRSTHDKYDDRALNAACRKDDDTISGGRAGANGNIAVPGTRASAASSTRMAFPSPTAPRQERGTNGRHRHETDRVSPTDDQSGVQDTRLSSEDESRGRAAAAVVPPRPSLDQDGRRAMWSVINEAIWEAYRRSPRMEDGSWESATHSSRVLSGEDDDERYCRYSAATAGTRSLKGDSDVQLWDYFAGRLSTTPQLHVGGGGDFDGQTLPLPSPSPDAHPLTCEGRGPVRPRQPTDTRSRTRGKAAAANDSDGQLSDVGSHDTAALQRRVLHEQQLRREADEAVRAARAQIAALEMATNDMAESLLTHRLAVTFRAHLEGMETLVGRWTRLAQNFCLQKSLLFAEEVSAVVRQLLRVTCGVASLWPPKAQHQQPQSGRRPTSPYIEALTPKNDDREELWVSREDEESSDSRRGISLCTGPVETPRNSATVVANHPLRSTGGDEVPHHYGYRTDHPSRCSSPERQPLQKPLPTVIPTSSSFSFPTHLQLRPLSLRV
ncbi:hypothetical protein, conserved [Leishmania tarentolae]|uniref:Uncharacterized protein n=1 Tax=Leishmania tarentolae TaxID=5689 RepID=A0A640KJF3_LEITA|nr:hypothetical protein, conserved [Leishmania tarentolae]